MIYPPGMISALQMIYAEAYGRGRLRHIVKQMLRLGNIHKFTITIIGKKHKGVLWDI